MEHQKLTKAEEQIMHLLWQQDEPRTVSQLIDQMDDPRPPHSTISSIIRILEKKGFVSHKAYGRTHVYFPAIDKKAYTQFSIAKLVNSYFEGSINELVSFLVKENDISIKDLGHIVEQLSSDKD